MYEFDLSGQVTMGTAGTLTLSPRLGTTDIYGASVTLAASGAFHYRGYIIALAAAGASANIGGGATLEQATGTNAKIGTVTAQPTYATAATNGALTGGFSAVFGTSNGSNAIFIQSGRVTGHALTAIFS